MRRAPIYMMNISEEKWVFDSHILIYALDKDSPYHLLTVHLFQQFRNGKSFPIVTQQNILEAEAVLVKYYQIKPEIVTSALEELLEAFQFEVVAPHPTTYIRYHTIVRASQSKADLYDCFLAATILDNNITRLITANDKDFVGIEGLSLYNPFKQI